MIGSNPPTYSPIILHNQQPKLTWIPHISTEKGRQKVDGSAVLEKKVEGDKMAELLPKNIAIPGWNKHPFITWNSRGTLNVMKTGGFTASAAKTLLSLHNLSYHTQPRPTIAK